MNWSVLRTKLAWKPEEIRHFLIFSDHEGPRDLNIPICLNALMHKNRIYCSILLKTQFVPLLRSPDSKSQ